MTDIEFFAVGAKMRQAQKKFHAAAKGSDDWKYWLEESKRIEGIFDREIQRRLQTTQKGDLAKAWAQFDRCYATSITPELGL